MSGIRRDEQDPQTYHVDWAAVHAGLNPWKRGTRVAVDPFLVGKAVRLVMRQCPHLTATGRPLVWNEFSVFLDLEDWERIKKLETTLVRDMTEVVDKELSKLKAEMVGTFTVRLLRDEGGTVRAGSAIVKVDFAEGEKLVAPDPAEMTVRIGAPIAKSLTDLTARVPDVGQIADGPELMRLNWEGGSANLRSGGRVVLGRPHDNSSPGFVPLTGAGTKINKRHFWIEAAGQGAVIGRFSRANPVQVKGRLIQPGGQLAIDSLPAEISLSSGELVLMLEPIRSAAAASA